MIATVLYIIFWIHGLISNDTDSRQWALILALTAYIILLGEREYRRGKILGPKQENEARELIIRITSQAQDFLKVMDNYSG